MPRISFQGEPGANSHIACKDCYPDMEPMPCDTFEDAFAAVRSGKAPVAAQMIKRSVNAVASALDQSIMHMDFDQNLLANSTEDAHEARSAYRAKREPTFTGR